MAEELAGVPVGRVDSVEAVHWVAQVPTVVETVEEGAAVLEETVASKAAAVDREGARSVVRVHVAAATVEASGAA